MWECAVIRSNRLTFMVRGLRGYGLFPEIWAAYFGKKNCRLDPTGLKCAGNHQKSRIQNIREPQESEDPTRICLETLVGRLYGKNTVQQSRTVVSRPFRPVSIMILCQLVSVRKLAAPQSAGQLAAPGVYMRITRLHALLIVVCPRRE